MGRNSRSASCDPRYQQPNLAVDGDEEYAWPSPQVTIQPVTAN